eukprot:scaffold1351_cov176-Amphora_coffeaeformis.AAC.24
MAIFCPLQRLGDELVNVPHLRRIRKRHVIVAKRSYYSSVKGDPTLGLFPRQQCETSVFGRFRRAILSPKVASPIVEIDLLGQMACTNTTRLPRDVAYNGPFSWDCCHPLAGRAVQLQKDSEVINVTKDAEIASPFSFINLHNDDPTRGSQ